MASRSFEVSINPEIIKWARESAGWGVEEMLFNYFFDCKHF